MTQDEHRLIVTMLAQQMQVSMMILEILESRDVLQNDDLAAFSSLPQPAAPAIERVAAFYEQVSQSLGVDAQLGNPPSA